MHWGPIVILSFKWRLKLTAFLVQLQLNIKYTPVCRYFFPVKPPAHPFRNSVSGHFRGTGTRLRFTRMFNLVTAACFIYCMDKCVCVFVSHCFSSESIKLNSVLGRENKNEAVVNPFLSAGNLNMRVNGPSVPSCINTHHQSVSLPGQSSFLSDVIHKLITCHLEMDRLATTPELPTQTFPLLLLKLLTQL